MNNLNVKSKVPFDFYRFSSLGAVILWCWSGVCFRAGSASLSPMVYLSLSSAVGVITIVLIRVFTGKSVTSLFIIPWRVALTGFFGVAIYTVFLVTAIGIADERDIGQVMLINYLWPMLIIIMSIFLLDRKPSIIPATTGAIMGFSGVIIAGGVYGLSRAPSSLIPHLLAFSGAFLWALYCVLLKYWRIPEKQAGSTFHFTSCALLSAVIAAIWREWSILERIEYRTILWILFLGAGPIGLAYHWWEIGIKKGAIHFAALLAYFTPIGSALLIGIIFRESLTTGLIPGAVMISFGAYVGGKAT